MQLRKMNRSCFGSAGFHFMKKPSLRLCFRLLQEVPQFPLANVSTSAYADGFLVEKKTESINIAGGDGLRT